jgi:hypothetical protein
MNDIISTKKNVSTQFFMLKWGIGSGFDAATFEKVPVIASFDQLRPKNRSLIARSNIEVRKDVPEQEILKPSCQ